MEWAIYEKLYMDDDIGKEIHRKVDLDDVFNSFVQIRRLVEAEKEDDLKNKVDRIKHYQYGIVVEYKGVPCYKI